MNVGYSPNKCDFMLSVQGIKVALLFPINYFKGVAYINILWLKLLVEECVLSLKEKKHNFGFPTFKLPEQSFKTDLLNIVFDYFDMWFLCYRIEFGCLCIPQGRCFIRSLWLCRTEEYVFFLFWAKVHL